MTERRIQFNLPETAAERHDRRGDKYYYIKANEATDPNLAFEAQQVHAESYLGEGFIHKEAINEAGQVDDTIDHARGDNVTYYLGRTGEAPSDRSVSTLRKVSIPEGEDEASLPGYQLSSETLTDEGREALRIAHAQGRTIVEISSFGHIPEVPATAGLELLRHVLQDSYKERELWFFSMVTQKHNTLVSLFGPHAVRKIGEPVAIEDDRVGESVTLTPTIVDTATFFDDVAKAATDPLIDPRNRRRHATFLRQFAAGVPEKDLSETVQLLLDESQPFVFSEYIQGRDNLQQGRWTEPLRLDLSERTDALFAKRLVDEGQVERVVNPAWHEEYPEGAIEPVIDADGSWFHYPWNKSLVHFPDQDTYAHLRHLRDRNLIREDEAERLRAAKPLVAGLSVGSHVAEQLVMAGVGDQIALADFDELSVSNLNRFHAGMQNVGEAKLDIIAKRVSELDPYVQQTHYREGVTKEVLESLEDVSIIFDEVDDFAAKALIRRYARAKGIPVVMATDVGYKSIIDVERYDLEMTKPFHGAVSEEMLQRMAEGEFSDPEDEAAQKEKARLTARIVGLSNASFRLLDSMASPDITWLPQLGVTASQGGSLATIVAQDILLGRTVPTGRRVHDARKALRLGRQDSRLENFNSVKQFLSKP